MAPWRCFENRVHFNVSLIVDKVDVAFSQDAKPTMCFTFWTGFHVYLRHVMNCLKAGVGQVHWAIYTRVHEHTHSHTCTHANGDISLSKIEKQIWNHGGDFCLVDLVFLFCQWTLNWCVTVSDFSFSNWRWRTREVILLPTLFLQITTELFWFGFVFHEPRFVKNRFPYWSI